MSNSHNARVIAARLVLAAAIASLASAQATGIDITAATAGITDASTALLALLGAFIGLSASIFGVTKVYDFLKRKAGA